MTNWREASRDLQVRKQLKPFTVVGIVISSLVVPLLGIVYIAALPPVRHNRALFIFLLLVSVCQGYLLFFSLPGFGSISDRFQLG